MVKCEHCEKECDDFDEDWTQEDAWKEFDELMEGVPEGLPMEEYQPMVLCHECFCEIFPERCET